MKKGTAKLVKEKTLIHPTAIIEPGADIDPSVQIAPYCHVGPKASLEKGVILHSHVVVEGNTKIGANTHIYPFACIGTSPQDLKFKGENSKLIIGRNNIIREHVTINPGTDGGGMITQIGDNCLFMVGSHVAHDCKVGNNVILANNATLAGHVQVGDFAIIGGLSAVHQFVRIGKHAIVGGMSGIESDIIPYGSAIGERASLAGLNIVGLKRRGFERDNIHTLRSAYRLLFSPEGTLMERLNDVAERFKGNEIVEDIIDFIQTDSTRAICVPKNGKQNS